MKPWQKGELSGQWDLHTGRYKTYPLLPTAHLQCLENSGHLLAAPVPFQPWVVCALEWSFWALTPPFGPPALVSLFLLTLHSMSTFPHCPLPSPVRHCLAFPEYPPLLRTYLCAQLRAHLCCSLCLWLLELYSWTLPQGEGRSEACADQGGDLRLRKLHSGQGQCTRKCVGLSWQWPSGLLLFQVPSMETPQSFTTSAAVSTSVFPKTRMLSIIPCHSFCWSSTFHKSCLCILRFDLHWAMVC